MAAEVDSRRRPLEEGRRRSQMFLSLPLPLVSRHIRQRQLWGPHHHCRVFGMPNPDTGTPPLDFAGWAAWLAKLVNGELNPAAGSPP
jgi:hypothetical protein